MKIMQDRMDVNVVHSRTATHTELFLLYIHWHWILSLLISRLNPMIEKLLLSIDEHILYVEHPTGLNHGQMLVSI